ncbi:MAG TPA: hypothetical protein HPP56_07845, partial [Nitrospirae bacterium]|nr:hypothetical protein [Nitrospirota bacterium]
MNNLERNIQDIINKNGPISFKEFMQIALYAPEKGSYIIAMGIDKVIVDLYGNNPDAFELTKIKGLFLPEGFGN